jgi:3-oxoacyl-[acyl-carrier protein] reductase
MSLVIDADGHVEENLAELVGAIPAAMQPHAMRFVSVAGGHVSYEIEGRLWRSKYPYPTERPSTRETEHGRNGRVALVTGGGRGIGRAISVGLAEDGFDVAVNYRRDKDAADETVAEIARLGRRGESFQASVDSLEDTRSMVDAVVAGFGQLDAVVHNAGVTNRGRTVANTDLADLERVMGIHAFGAHQVCQLAVPHLRSRPRGDVVLISSQSTQSFDPNSAPYTMAKAGLEALAFTLAREQARNGIRVNVVAGGLVNHRDGAPPRQGRPGRRRHPRSRPERAPGAGVRARGNGSATASPRH